jgi:hypothetical protein
MQCKRPSHEHCFQVTSTLFFDYIINLFFCNLWILKRTQASSQGLFFALSVGRGNKVVRGLFFVVYSKKLLHKFIESLLTKQNKVKV